MLTDCVECRAFFARARPRDGEESWFLKTGLGPSQQLCARLPSSCLPLSLSVCLSWFLLGWHGAAAACVFCLPSAFVCVSLCLLSPVPTATIRLCLCSTAQLTTFPWFRRVAYRHAAHGISIHRNISDIERRFAECASTPIDGKQFIIQGQPKPKPRLAPTVLRSSTGAVDRCLPPLRLVTSLASTSCVPRVSGVGCATSHRYPAVLTCRDPFFRRPVFVCTLSKHQSVLVVRCIL
eukprot:COSAG04_NODE_891_length_9607_cov_13.087085_3_plen_236_part_00